MGNYLNKMLRKAKFIYMIFLVLFLCSFENVTDEEMISMGATSEVLQELKADVISPRTGDIDFPVCHAHVTVPQGFVFMDIEQTKKLLVDYWGNPEDRMEDVIGSLVPASCEAFYQIAVAYIISYENCGYIKDDDASSIDYDELMKQIQKASAEANESLPVEQRLTIKGWAVTPQYLKSSHTLIWAKTVGSVDGESVNYDMRILGKDGLVSLNAVADPTALDEIVSTGSMMMNSVTFDNGYAYSDFDPKRDRISDWTIGGLIAGGVLAKTGFFAKLGVLLVKFWKLIAVAVIAIGASIKKIFKKRD
ncbi:MAG: DUF2167 domain-containing protein [Prevotella sp.]|nr:DUF2167 domain-containing protein [Prevotella sp.]